MTASPVAAAALYAYRLPLRRPLAAGGRTLTARAGWLLRLTDADGRTGWGDAAPLPGFSAESHDASGAALRAWLRCAGGPAPAAAPRPDLPPSAGFAVGAARAALAAHDAPPGGTVVLNGLLLGTPETVRTTARARYDAGYRVLKLKVGRTDPDAEAALVRALAADLPGVRLRLDANRAWTWTEAIRFADRVRDLPVDYLEEPLRDAARLRAFAEASGLPVALDESLATRSPDEPLGWAAAVVLKPTLLGYDRTRRWMAAARANGCRAALSAAFESGVGLAALVALAAAGDGTPAGLDTYGWLAEDVLEQPLPLGPQADVRAVRAAGARVREDRLERIEGWTA